MCVVSIHIWDMCTCMWCLYRYVVYKFVYVYFSLRQGILHSWLYGRSKRNTKKKGQISGTGVGKPLSGTKLGQIDITGGEQSSNHWVYKKDTVAKRKQGTIGLRWLYTGDLPFLDVSSVLPKVSP